MSGEPVIANDPIAVSSAGMMRSAKPTTPTLSVSASSGTVVATITGDSGVTNYLKYKSSSQTSWQLGGSRQGDGTITVTGLDSGILYIFVAYSEAGTGLTSLPSVPATVRFAVTAENEFDELLADTADDFLTEFGEPVTYLPYGGGEREITAIVDREPPEELVSGVHGARLVVDVANDSEEGISSSEINVSKDKIELSVRRGETAVEKLITKIISQDAGMMKLAVN